MGVIVVRTALKEIVVGVAMREIVVGVAMRMIVFGVAIQTNEKRTERRVLLQWQRVRKS